MNNFLMMIDQYVDKKTVFSVIAAGLLTSGVVYVAVKSGIKPLAAVAKAAK